MKNQGILGMFIVGMLFLNACMVIHNNGSVSLNQSPVVADDLYDAPVKSNVVVRKKTKSNYLDFQDDASLLDEERGLVNRVEPNYLNSRSVYSNSYNQGFSNGFAIGSTNVNPWNNWYNNPYVTFGTGFGSRWLSPLASWQLNDPFYLGMGSSMYNPMMYNGFAYNSSFFMNPYYYDPFYRMSPYYNPFNSMYSGGFGNSYGFGQTNIYNYYGGLNSSAQVVNPYQNDPAPVYRRGPRDEQMSNRFVGDANNNMPRGSNNTYNVDGTNQPRVNSGNSNMNSSEPAQSRRNTNYEYRAAPQNSNGSQFQNRTESYSAPASNFGGNSSGGSSGGSVGGSSGGSRGPR